ncbi:uncharacterized protein LOC124315956 [Daphnia pulicaria]|uniref:uncharacterized protein LOC124315956 n=1 Tax=Daphnia pulicaria TaxID=35523 RepID=UPI001EEA825C|nr:uncharacterized protein LOC124315956 [Daphnia pulicaria]
MYKSMTLLVLVALAACAFAMEAQDQESAEQYYRIHGFYPSWYPYGIAFNGVRAFPGYPFTGYPAAVAGVKNVAYPYAPYPYAYGAYPYGAIPYVAPVPEATPAKKA